MDYYGSSYGNAYNDAVMAGIGATYGVFMLIALACSMVMVIALWKINVKAGEPGWAAIVPFYNTYVLYKITWGNGWAFLFLLIPFVNIVIAVITMIKLAQVFGKGTGFAIGLIFLPFIFQLILAFSDAKYQGVPL